MHFRKMGLLLALLLNLPLYAQDPAAVSVGISNLTTTLPGKWIGIARHRNTDGLVNDPISIEITGSRAKKTIHLKFIPERKWGEPYQETMSFDSALSRVSYTEQMGRKRTYQATGLEKISATGYGAFVISSIAPTVDADGNKHFFRGTYHLAPSNLSFDWEKSSDGTNFFITYHYELVRQKD